MFKKPAFWVLAVIVIGAIIWAVVNHNQKKDSGTAKQ